MSSTDPIHQLAQALLKRIQQSTSSASSLTQASTYASQLRNDKELASNISRLSNTSSASASSSVSSPSPQLPSMAPPRHPYTPKYQPYSRKKRTKTTKEKVYDMKLIVLNLNLKLVNHGELSGFQGHYILESPIRVREHDTNTFIRHQMLDIIRQRYPEFSGDYVYVTRPKRTQLLKCPTQTLDGKGVHTLKSKSTGNVYIMLTDDIQNGNSDEEEDMETDLVEE